LIFKYRRIRMEFELTIKADEPTRNGRIYSKEVLLNALNRMKEFPIVTSSDDISKGRVDISKVQCFSSSSNISEDNKITIETGNVFGKIMKKIIDEKLSIKLNPISFGIIDQDKNVSDLTLIGFSLDLES